jgi:uncharacterized protein (UPF0303 family)
MSIPDDLAVILRQEATLILPEFSAEVAWKLGTTIRDLAISRKQSIVVDIRRFGAPHQQLFYCALDGTTPDNQRWVARKIAVVARFHKSSYHVGRLLEQTGLTFADRYNLPEEDYAAHGGCFPLRTASTGIVGAITVSGLPQREDHNIVVEALCTLTGHDYAKFRLPE